MMVVELTGLTVIFVLSLVCPFTMTDSLFLMAYNVGVCTHYQHKKMTEKEVYEIGFDRGVKFARFSDGDATLDDILECEFNDRQFSPFEDLAHEINLQNCSEDLWDQFDDGIYDGINSILGDS